MPPKEGKEVVVPPPEPLALTPEVIAAIAAAVSAAMAQASAQTAVTSQSPQRGAQNWAEMVEETKDAFPSGSLPAAKQRPEFVQGTSRNAAPALGAPGSGYTRISNGKLVKNKRPKQRSLPERQALNWRTRATEALISLRQANGLQKGDQCPAEIAEAHSRLIADLEMSKAYQAYVEETGDPKEVHVWRAERHTGGN
jgi:hypothetical protein